MSDELIIVRRIRRRRVVAFFSTWPGAGTTTTVINVAGRLARHGEIAVLDCDLWGAGPAGLIGDKDDCCRLGLAAVLRAGVSLSPTGLLDDAVSICPHPVAGTSPVSGAGAVWVVGGARSLCSDGEHLRDDSLWSLRLESEQQIAARCEEILTLLSDWVSVPTTSRWVLVDVPPHPTVAPAILDAICAVADRRSPEDRLSASDPVVLGCFAGDQRQHWQVDDLGQRLEHTKTVRFFPFCSRESRLANCSSRTPAARAATSAQPRPKLLMDAGRDASHAPADHGTVSVRLPGPPPSIPFEPAFADAEPALDHESGEGGCSRAAAAYDRFVEWLRVLPT